MKTFCWVLLIFFAGKSFAQSRLPFASSALPRIFAPGFITDGFENRDMAISPTNDELFFTIQHKAFSVIMTSKKKGEVWSRPEVASFSGRHNDLEAAFNADGKRIYFSSNRPMIKEKPAADYNIWFVEKRGTGWTEPAPLGQEINSGKDEFYPSLARNGNLYFTRENDSTKEDIFVAEFSNGNYSAPKALPMEVNSMGYDFNAFVDPDEEFIIFTSYKRKDDKGGGDLYISAKKNGQWQAAKNLGDAINSTSIDYCPFVSFDKKHFFFTSKRTTFLQGSTKPMNAKMIKEILSSPGNGSDDIYVVDFDPIRGLLGE